MHSAPPARPLAVGRARPCECAAPAPPKGCAAHSAASQCARAAQYGALLLVDAEEEYYAEEVAKLARDVEAGLGLLVFGEWYNVDTMVRMRFFDDNTRSWWTPATGAPPRAPNPRLRCSSFARLSDWTALHRSVCPAWQTGRRI